MLAYRRLSFSVMDRSLNNIENFTEEALMDPEIIEMICRNYCSYGIHITKSGWKFLIDHYGYDGLYEIDKKCGRGFYDWNFSEYADHSLEEYIRWINDRTESYPNVPDSVYISDRPESIARSALRVGKTVEEVAELFEMPLKYVQRLDKEVKAAEKEREEEIKARYIRNDLSSGKTVEQISKDRNVTLEFVVQIYEEFKLYEKKRNVLDALFNGKTAAEISEELNVSLEYVQEIEKIVKEHKNARI